MTSESSAKSSFFSSVNILFQQSKNDLAQDLCRKTLLENKSCSQAWEILGLVFEKEANYELASDAYAKVSAVYVVLVLCACMREFFVFAVVV